MQLQTTRLTLRELDPKLDNFERYLEWMRDSVSNPFIEGVSNRLSMPDLIEYVHSKNESEDSILMGIFTNKESRHIGNVKLEPIFRGSYAYLGILIGDNEWRGKSVGKEAISCVLDFSFDELKLKEVRLGVDSTNTLARSLYSKIGFETTDLSAEGSSRLEMSIDSITWDKKRKSIL